MVRGSIILLILSGSAALLQRKLYGRPPLEKIIDAHLHFENRAVLPSLRDLEDLKKNKMFAAVCGVAVLGVKLQGPQ